MGTQWLYSSLNLTLALTLTVTVTLPTSLSLLTLIDTAGYCNIAMAYRQFSAFWRLARPLRLHLPPL